MARIRTIKPQFWTDESIVAMPYEYRLLYIGMWNFADDDGFLEDKPKQIKLQVFPGDDVNVMSGIRALVKHGMIERLSLNGSKVLRIKGWKEHQVISRPTKSQYADAYADYQAGRATHGALTEHSRSTPSGRERKGKERKGKESAQVGGGGTVSSDAPSAAADSKPDDYKPWRCADHQDVDVKCHGCALAKKAHRKQLEDEAAAAKAAQRQADADTKRAERERIDRERAEAEADPDAGRRAIEQFKQARKDVA